MKITFYFISIYTRYCIKYYKLRTLSQLLSWLIVKDLLEGHGNSLQYSCLENSMDRGARQATVHGITESMTEQLTFNTAREQARPCESQICVTALPCSTSVQKKHFIREIICSSSVLSRRLGNFSGPVSALGISGVD